MKRLVAATLLALVLVPAARPAGDVVRGKHLYGRYCLVCHGANGKGDGPLVVSGKIPTPPSYTSERVAPFPPGRLFHVVTMGTQNPAGAQKMPSYAALLTPNERWKVVGYVASKLQGGATP